MIERRFVIQNLKEHQIREFIAQNLKRVGHSFTKLQRTPLGEKIIIYASRPGLVVGRKGENIKKLTKILKKKFDLENPQIEINEVDNVDLDAQVVAERIVNSLERFGTSKFKGVGHKTMEDVINAGALGVEIVISGKIPGARAKSWRFYQGYLKKCGDIVEGIRKAHATAQIKTGTIGVKVSIMPADINLPDKIKLLEEKIEIIEEVTEKEGESEKKPAKKVKEEAKEPKTQEIKKTNQKKEKKTEEKGEGKEKKSASKESKKGKSKEVKDEG